MNGVPIPCQALKQRLDELEAEKKGLQAELRKAAGTEKWDLLRTIASVTRVIDATNKRLTDCVTAFGNPYRVDLVISDLVPGGSVIRPVTGHLWYQASPTSHTLVESVPDQNDTCVFARSGVPSAGTIALSVDEDGSLTFDGPLFRSGGLGRLPASSIGRPAPTVEIVAAPAVTIPPSAITAPANFAAPAGITLSGAPSVTLGSGGLTFTASGTVLVYPIYDFLVNFLQQLGRDVPQIPVPFTYDLTLSLLPSDDVGAPAKVCVLRPAGPASIGIQLLQSPAYALSNPMTNAVVASLEPMLNGIIVASVAGAIPAGGILSARKFVVTATGVRFFPAVGRFLP